MKKLNKYSIITVLVIGFVLSFGGLVKAGPTTVDLGTANDFAILAGTGITNVATSTIMGDVGLSPTTGAAITGLACVEVTGTIYDVDGTYPDTCETTNAPLLTTAKNDLTAAFIDAAARTPLTTVATELGGQTLVAGVYDSASTTFQITAGAGDLVLDGEGDASAVFIFQMDADGTGLTVGPGSTVSLINGAQACNVFWRVDTAAIDTTAVFKGNILALNSITVANGADIEGRLLARNGNVTLISDTITRADCAEETPPPEEDTDTTPGLPDTGIAPSDKGNTLQNLLIPVGIMAGLSSVYLARKKRSV